MLKRSQIKLPTPAEDAAITAAALQDPDAQPLTDAELAQFKRAPGRPRGSHKASTTVRFDADVLDAFRASGPRWQTRMKKHCATGSSRILRCNSQADTHPTQPSPAGMAPKQGLRPQNLNSLLRRFGLTGKLG